MAGSKDSQDWQADVSLNSSMVGVQYKNMVVLLLELALASEEAGALPFLAGLTSSDTKTDARG